MSGNGHSHWYSDWQNDRHARLFDARAVLSTGALIRNYESFNDVRILREGYAVTAPESLLEVGCATGEFYRYLRHRYPKTRYLGVDVSAPALERAQRKYPEGQFLQIDPDRPIAESLQAAGLPTTWEVVYSKDVAHHQTDPWGFIAQVLALSAKMLILRTRTRNVGPTVLDPDRSCQYHYDGWMPYLVLNLQELREFLRSKAPHSCLWIYRHPMILGGRENRFLPKECFLSETGTAETAVGLFLHPGKLTDRQEDRIDMQGTSSWASRFLGRVRSSAVSQ